jgi:hypothetical protein
MQRSGSGSLLSIVPVSLALIGAMLAALTGCLGKSSSNGGAQGVQSVTLSPVNRVSLDLGGTVVFTATGRDAQGRTVLGVNIQFVVQSATPGASSPLSVASNGAACAGTWDPTATMCSPGTPGAALVTAVIEGVSSPPTTVYVHQHVDSIQISQAESQPPQYDCFSQGDTWQFQGTAYSNGVDITNTVGPLNWSSSNSGVVTTVTSVPTLLPNQVQTTASSPGITQLFANVSGTTSSPYPYTTCLVQSVRLQIAGQGQAGDSVTVTNGGGVNITATVVDTLGFTLARPPLTWGTSNGEIASFSSTTSTTGSNNATTRNNLGGAVVTGSCSPPTCNIGVLPGLPIYASDGPLPNGSKGYSSISINVTSTSKPPTYTGWAATTECGGALGCSSAMFSVVPGTNPIGGILSLSRTPNSMIFSPQAARVYLGSDQGLMYVDVTSASPSATLISSSSTPCNSALCGKVLTISTEGKFVVVGDTVSNPGQVYIYNSAASGGTAAVDLVLTAPGEKAVTAAFSPDELKLFVLTNQGNLYVYSTVNALSSLPLAATATDIAFSADSSFAFLAGAVSPANSVAGFATCNTQQTHHDSLLGPPLDFDIVTTPGIPQRLFPSPDAQHVLALDPPYVDIFAFVDEQIPLQDGETACHTPTVNFPQSAQSFNLGQGTFTPLFSRLVANGTEMIVVAQNIPAVLVFNVNNGTTTSVPLLGSAATGCPKCSGASTPLAADASTDGSQVDVAACDVYTNNDPAQPCAAGSVHIINTVSQGDVQQVPYTNVNQQNDPNMCNNQGGSAPLCLPNLIALKPQ